MMDVSSGTERRVYARLASCEIGRVRTGRAAFACTVLDYSPGGARLGTDAVLAPGAHVALEIDGLDALAARVVRTGAGTMAIRFDSAPVYTFR